MIADKIMLQSSFQCAFICIDRIVSQILSSEDFDCAIYILAGRATSAVALWLTMQEKHCCSVLLDFIRSVKATVN